MRIPNSINGKCLNKERRLKNNLSVKTIKEWNRIRPIISNDYLEHFSDYIIQKKIISFNENSNNNKNIHKINYNTHLHYYQWIEKLLQTPIEDFRKLVLWRILYPYLINVRKLSDDESFYILKQWLDKCNLLRKLDFNYNQKIRYDLKNVGKFYPLGIQKLKNDTKNFDLYNLLKKSDIIR